MFFPPGILVNENGSLLYRAAKAKKQRDYEEKYLQNLSCSNLFCTKDPRKNRNRNQVYIKNLKPGWRITHKEMLAALSNPRNKSKFNNGAFKQVGCTSYTYPQIPEGARSVDLSNGALRYIFDLSGQEHSSGVEALNISKNSIVELHVDDGSFKKLRKLDASINVINVAPELEKLCALEKCNLSYNDALFLVDREYFSLPKSLQELDLSYTFTPKYSKFDLRSSNYEEVMLYLAKALKSTVNLKRLSLAGNDLSAIGKDFALPRSITLEKLPEDLKVKFFKDNDYHEYLAKLKRHYEAKKEHNDDLMKEVEGLVRTAWESKVDISISEEGYPISPISRVSPFSKSDKHIGIADHKLSEEFKSFVLSYFPKEFRFPDSLEVLDLSDTGIKSTDFKCLYNLKNLKELDISFAYIDNTEHLLNLLKQLPNLVKLKHTLGYAGDQESPRLPPGYQLL